MIPFLRRPAWIALALLVAAALACGVDISTAHFEDAKLYQDRGGTAKTRTYSPADTFYCIAALKKAPDSTPVEGVWQRVTIEGENREAIEVARSAFTANNGTIVFESAPPAGGWPLGDYEVVLYLDGHRQLALEFQVK